MSTDPNAPKQTSTLAPSSPSRWAGVKTFAKVAGASATGTLVATGIAGGAKAAYHAVKGEKTETAKAALGGATRILRSLR